MKKAINTYFKNDALSKVYTLLENHLLNQSPKFMDSAEEDNQFKKLFPEPKDVDLEKLYAQIENANGVNMTVEHG
jgi:hypothetical protein